MILRYCLTPLGPFGIILLGYRKTLTLPMDPIWVCLYITFPPCLSGSSSIFSPVHGAVWHWPSIHDAFIQPKVPLWAQATFPHPLPCILKPSAPTHHPFHSTLIPNSKIPFFLWIPNSHLRLRNKSTDILLVAEKVSRRKTCPGTVGDILMYLIASPLEDLQLSCSRWVSIKSLQKTFWPSAYQRKNSGAID